MSSLDRRRSDRFADLLDEVNGRPRNHRRNGVDDELERLVQVAGRVSALSALAPAPRAEFRSDLRATLLARIEREGIGATADERVKQVAIRAALAGETKPIRQMPTSRSGRTRAALLAGVTAGALALSGVSAASTEALPGDPLYQVKRSTELAQLALAGSDQSRGHLYLEFAQNRLREARKVAPERLAAVLADMDVVTTSGASLLATAAVHQADAGALAALATFVSQQRARLGDLAGALPNDAAESVRSSLALLDAVQARATSLTNALAKGCAIPTVDDLGPRPVAC